MRHALSVVFCLLLAAASAQASSLESAIQLFEQRRLAEAKTAFEALANANPPRAEAFYYLARIAAIEGDSERAVKMAERAVELNGTSAEYHFWLGRAYGEVAQKSNKLKAAFLAKKVQAEFETAVKLDPNLVFARFALIDFYMMAPSFMGGSEEKAMEQANEISKRDPLRGFSARASIYRRQKKNDLVEKEYLAAAKAFPVKSQPHVWLSSYYAEAKNYHRAFEELDTAIRTEPGYMPAYFSYGRLAVISGKNLERGEESLKKYLTYMPKDNEAPHSSTHFRLGWIYEKQDRKDLARREYQEALKMSPAFKDAREALDRLNNVVASR